MLSITMSATRNLPLSMNSPKVTLSTSLKRSTKAIRKFEVVIIKIIQNMLKSNRTVVNLFGRTRLFLGPIFPSYSTPKGACEDTYRQAYAHMAQSTCADKINEQGVEIYLLPSGPYLSRWSC